jgi:SAM-dependent methyltransferase
MYRLFHEFAHRYDLHTPPGHYQHDHALVIQEALKAFPIACRLLDIGCGTGVFLESAISSGIDGHGVDVAPEMVGVAEQRLGPGRVRVLRMQELSDQNAYDVICALSWTIHYSETKRELDDVLRRCNRALHGAGLLILQVANDEQMTGAVNVEREPGPSGELDDTCFIHRFHSSKDLDHTVIAEYVYTSEALSELLYEKHELRFASPFMIADAMRRSGFQAIHIVNPTSVSPFVVGVAA